MLGEWWCAWPAKEATPADRRGRERGTIQGTKSGANSVGSACERSTPSRVRGRAAGRRVNRRTFAMALKEGKGAGKEGEYLSSKAGHGFQSVGFGNVENEMRVPRREALGAAAGFGLGFTSSSRAELGVQRIAPESQCRLFGLVVTEARLRPLRGKGDNSVQQRQELSTGLSRADPSVPCGGAGEQGTGGDAIQTELIVSRRNRSSGQEPRGLLWKEWYCWRSVSLRSHAANPSWPSVPEKRAEDRSGSQRRRDPSFIPALQWQRHSRGCDDER